MSGRFRTFNHAMIPGHERGQNVLFIMTYQPMLDCLSCSGHTNRNVNHRMLGTKSVRIGRACAQPQKSDETGPTRFQKYRACTAALLSPDTAI